MDASTTHGPLSDRIRAAAIARAERRAAIVEAARDIMAGPGRADPDATIRTIIAHPEGGYLYASPYLWRDASYAFTHQYSQGRLWDGGWRPVELDDVPEHLREDAAELTPGEYVDDQDRDELEAAIVEAARDIMAGPGRADPDAFDLAYLILGPGSDARPVSPWVARAIARTLPPKELAR